VSLRLGEMELRKTIRLSAEKAKRHDIVGHRGYAKLLNLRNSGGHDR
jgi:hypothetical protein